MSSLLSARSRAGVFVIGRARRCVLALLLGLASFGAARADELSLDACIERALAAHPGLRAEARAVDAARARGRSAGALEPPSLSYAFGKLGTPVSADEREASWRVSQDVPFPGARGRAREVGRLEVAVAEAQRDAFALKLRGDVTSRYRRLQADQLGVQTLRQLSATATDLEQLIGIRLRTGGARYLDVLRARAERARLENDTIEAERALHEDRRALNGLMARELEAPLTPSDSLVFTPLADSLSTVLAQARAGRPGVRRARLEIERASAQVAQARSARLPAAALALGLDRVPGSDTPGVGGEVSLSLPFLPWTDRGAQATEGRAARDEATARLEAAERDLEAVLRTAFQSAHSSAEQLRRFDDLLLADAADGIRAAIQNYQQGQIDALELFETLRTFRAVQLERIRALLNYELAIGDLNHAE